MKKKKKPGFTLVEMVIVVTILGILSSLGFMKLGRVQETARENSDYVAASSLSTATSLALSDRSIKEGVEGNVEIADLITAGYLSLEPKPQSKGSEFKIKLDKDSNIIVSIDDEPFYPKELYSDEVSVK